ncbi:hypothetical protein BVX99_00300 [bacterium F16]|nr:hypothetical protein BVX99_00300 [bacterium F16]
MYLIRIMALCVLFLLIGCQKSRRKNATNTIRAKKTLTPEQQKQLVKKQLYDIFVREIEIAGIVVDEHGAPLKDVELFYTVHDSRKGSIRHNTVLKDGRFSFKYEKCLAMDLYFNKDGHFRKKMVFSPHSPNDWAPPKWKEVNLGNGRAAIRETDLKVELESIGGPWNEMDKYWVSCEFSPTGKWKGTVFTPNPDYSEENRKKWSMKPFLTKVVEFPPGNIPDNCIYLTAPMTDGGKVLEIEKTFQLDNHKYWFNIDGSPRYISLNGKGNLAFQEANNLKQIDPVRYDGEWELLMARQLKKAPEEGYQKKVDVIPAADMEYRFCYIKVFDQYGQLAISPPNSIRRDKQERVKVGFHLYLQPNGSRDVRSMEGAPYFRSKPKAKAAGIKKKGIRKGHYSYLLQGKVQDITGKPLRDYQIEFDPNKGYGSIKKLSFADKFSLETTSHVVRFCVQKPGYYAKPFILYSSDVAQLKKLGITREGKQIKATDMIVQLEETGPLTPMIVTSLMPGDIKFKVDENSIGISLRIKGRALFLDSKPYKIPKKGVPKESILFVRGAVQNGKIKMPLEMHYGIGGKGNGVIPFTPKGKSKETGILLREMKDAPETGYLNEVKLDAAKKMNFFFFKFDDFYGKGYVKFPPKVSKNGKQLLPQVSLCLQPNKSRNVRTK